jgi:hypothetical protein
MSPIVPSDSCSWNGLSRRELLWRDARLHGTTGLLICTYCVALSHDVLAEAPGALPPPELRCSYCRRHGRLCAGPAHFICEACVEGFAAVEGPSWGSVLRGLEGPGDAACLLYLARASWATLRANGIPIAHCEASLDDLARTLSPEGLRGLGWWDRALPWSAEDLRAAPPPTHDQVARLLRRLEAGGVRLQMDEPLP